MEVVHVFEGGEPRKFWAHIPDREIGYGTTPSTIPSFTYKLFQVVITEGTIELPQVYR